MTYCLRAQVMLLAAMAAAIGTPASAWQAIREADKCGFSATFDGPGETTVIFVQSREVFSKGFVSLYLGNANWSLKEGDVVREPIKLDADGHEIISNAAVAPNALVLNFRTEVMDEFADGHPLGVSVFRGPDLISRLQFGASFYSEYIGYLACRRKWEKERDDRSRLEGYAKSVPADPFAKP